MRHAKVRWIIVTAILLAAGCTSNRPAPSFGVIGAWRSSIQFTSGAFAPVQDLEFLYVFNEGGTLTESSNYDAAPPVPPAYGVWRQVKPDEFVARYEFFMTAPSKPEAFSTGGGWLPSGRGVLTERIKLSRDGHSFTSTIRYEAFDAKGDPIEGGGTGKGRGARIMIVDR